MSEKTHFGFRDVDRNEKQGLVADVFHSVASKYDIMNDLMSMGIHRLWKRFTLDHGGVKPGDKVLDVAGGTGDLTIGFSKRVGQKGKVILSDINSSMLNEGRNRLINEGIVDNVDYVLANAEKLPFKDNQFDCISIGFGLRNVTDKDAALRSMFRILKPGGRLLILEFSKPLNPLFSKVYDFYSFNILPKVGQIVANDAQSYQYLAESIRMHPDQETLKSMVLDAGFDQCSYHNMTGGVVALHKAVKL